jgi:hypothetical protein
MFLALAGRDHIKITAMIIRISASLLHHEYYKFFRMKGTSGRKGVVPRLYRRIFYPWHSAWRLRFLGIGDACTDLPGQSSDC